jgi:hypothetical protein
MKKNEIQIFAQKVKTLGAAYNPPVTVIGEVLSTNPIKIKINQLELDKDDLKINPDALFSSGDMVLVQPLDTGKITQPIYVVICKVVNADA